VASPEPWISGLLEEVEIARLGRVLTGPREGQKIDSRRHHEGVHPGITGRAGVHGGVGIRSKNRLAQRAVPVGGSRRILVRRAVHSNRFGPGAIRKQERPGEHHAEENDT